MAYLVSTTLLPNNALVRLSFLLKTSVLYAFSYQPASSSCVCFAFSVARGSAAKRLVSFFQILYLVFSFKAILEYMKLFLNKLIFLDACLHKSDHGDIKALAPSLKEETNSVGRESTPRSTASAYRRFEQDLTGQGRTRKKL